LLVGSLSHPNGAFQKAIPMIPGRGWFLWFSIILGWTDILMWIKVGNLRYPAKKHVPGCEHIPISLLMKPMSYIYTHVMFFVI
jgi:hypothetical protein